MTSLTEKPFKLAVIGEVMAEISGKPFSKMQQSVGGDTYNTAVYLKQLLPANNTISFVSVMGTDVLSRSIVQRTQEYDLDISLLLTDDDKQVGLYYVENDEAGERFFHYWRNDSAARYLMQHKSAAAVFQKLTDYDAVFLSGISIAIMPYLDRLALIELLHTLKKMGVKIIFDGNYRERLWQNPEQAKSIYNQLYGLSDVALVTYDDEYQLWGDSTVEECQKRLLAFEITELVIKDGENGCIYATTEQAIVVPAQSVAEVIDTTAAGDSFNAGFLAGFFCEKSARFNCELGNCVAGQVIQQQGAIVKVDIQTKLSA